MLHYLSNCLRYHKNIDYLRLKNQKEYLSVCSHGHKNMCQCQEFVICLFGFAHYRNRSPSAYFHRFHFPIGRDYHK
ncbi:MAG: hypothetical protein DRI84_06700 [Bacteroidetes bacterium]|nr:MAG: hypothetical protein DRI84_06700 [Bacteroidota bacterium]